MSSLMSYSGITTKVKAMESNLLTEEQFREFVVLSSVSEAVSYLKKQPAYKSLFVDLDESMVHRGQIERLLNISMYGDFTKIYRFCNPDQRKFLNVYYLKYEATILKKVLRTIFNGSEQMANKDVLKSFLGHYSAIDTDALFAAKTIEEFTSSLKNTGYYSTLSKLDSISNPTLFDYEIAIDIYYFTNMWNMNKRLFKGKENKLIAQSFGSKIDLLNLQWIYRSKKYYNMTPADIYAIIIPVSYKVKKEELTRLVESANCDEFLAILKTTYYSRKFDSNIDSGDDMEDLYIKILNKINYSSSRNNPYSVAIINTYLYKKEHEINYITTALECIRYGLDPNETLKYIIK